MNGTVRLGVVGLGGICQSRHMPGFRELPGVEVVAVVNRTRRSSERAAQQWGIPDVAESWEALVARDDLDAVVIGAWPYLHCPVAVAALEAGKHVFCQARMAMDYAEARRMRDAARRAGRVAALCPVPIGLRIDRAVARLLKDGDLGEIRLVRAQSFSDAFADPETPMTWRKDHRLSGLNMHTLGMYVEVMHRWFGPTWLVHAQTQTFTATRRDESGESVRVRIPDQVLANTVMQAGFPVQYTISAAALHGEDQIQIFGSRASLVYDVGKDLLYGAEAGQPLGMVGIQPEEEYDVRNWRVERDFVDAVRAGSEYHPDFEDGLRYMQVVQAVYDSAREGRSIAIEEG